MPKLHHCINGTKVTEQVIKFQKSRESRDYLPIQLYYDNFKDKWFGELEDYMDRVTFDAEFDYKLCRAIDTFDNVQANKLAEKNGWSFLGAFNRWFYKILTNWKSNVKTSSFRMKKRPAVQCPICGRHVGRIDVEHLRHFKSLNEIPKFFVWKGSIYETCTTPKVNVVCWGERTAGKWYALLNGDVKSFQHEKHRVSWLWYKNETKMVVCPFTKKLVPVIDDEYLHSLPSKYSRYAEPTTWENFIERYPRALIQTEVFSLDHDEGETEQVFLRDHVSLNRRIERHSEVLDYDMICRSQVTLPYECAFQAIDKYVDDATDRDILKLVSAGYSIDDIAVTLGLDKKEVRKRMRAVRDNNDSLKRSLL